MSKAETPFRFDALTHEYTQNGVVLPHITEMLQRTGWINKEWYTDESSERGRQVHRLTADYDMGAIDLQTFVSPYRPWLLSYIAAVKMLRPIWDAIEAPTVHPQFRFGGRPDRVGQICGVYTVLELKSNNKGWNLEQAHPIQTALQAILVAGRGSLPAEAWKRYALYCRPDRRFRLEDHEKTRRKDFDEAYRIILECCR